MVQESKGSITELLHGNELDKKIIEIHRLLMHAGPEKVAAYMKDNYKAKNLLQQIRLVIQQCVPCQKMKVVTTSMKEPIQKLEASELFECIFVDIHGPLRETLGKKRYILGIIDQFSKYLSLTAILKQEESVVTKAILNNWILRFGSPRIIHVDCGKVFESKGMKDLAERV